MPRMNGFCRRRLAGREPGDVQVRHELADVRQVRDALLLDGFGREGADRDWDVVDALLALLRGHDDGFENGGFLRNDRLSGRQRRERQGAGDESQGFVVHCGNSPCPILDGGDDKPTLAIEWLRTRIVTPARTASGDPGVMLLLLLAFG